MVRREESKRNARESGYLLRACGRPYQTRAAPLSAKRFKIEAIFETRATSSIFRAFRAASASPPVVDGFLFCFPSSRQAAARLVDLLFSSTDRFIRERARSTRFRGRFSPSRFQRHLQA